MNRTGIDYLTHSWNPIAMRCSRVSPECLNCWHLAMCKRQAANPTLPLDVRAAKAGGPPILLAGELDAPRRLQKPARIGVQFMGDLFHEDVPDEFIDQVMARIGLAGHHTFLVLSKRPDRMARYFSGGGPVSTWGDIAKGILGEPVRATFPENLGLGTTCGHPDSLWRVEELLKCPAAVRFVSAEPLLGELDFSASLGEPYWYCTQCDAEKSPVQVTYEETCTRCEQPVEGRGGINWLIIGCESGPRRRPCKQEWAKSLIDQADAAGVPVFNKAFDLGDRISKDPAEWPEWARRREFPGAESEVRDV